VRTPDGERVIHCDLVVACDGRYSTVREAAGLTGREYGAPMDVLWFRLPRADSDPQDTFGIIGTGHMMVLLNRTEYWQVGFLIPKGAAQAMRDRPIDYLREAIDSLASFLQDRTDTLQSWEQVKTLEVHVDRLERWHRPGLLLIGDAAHAMSPVGGVGINLAIQDAVAAANRLATPLRAGGLIEESLLANVQHRRMPATKLTQAIQLQIQKRVISQALARSEGSLQVPAFLRWLLRFRAVRHLPARVFGYGFRREHVNSPDVFNS
jgi:2-polyprenyl-6-methoxyphenol hydroxylase-like FAD-dependent oxidoreductase